MPGTEDIAEKVADLLIDESLKAGKLLIDHIPLIKDGVLQNKGLAKKIFEVASKGTTKKQLENLEEQGEKLLLQQFWGIQKKLNLHSDTIRIANEDTPDFERLLRQQKMVFSVLDKSDDNYDVFVFLGKDSEKVTNAYNQLMARRGQISEMPVEQFLNVVNPDKIMLVDNMGDVEAELFRFYARERGLLFAHLPGTDGRPGQIMYLPKDVEKARDVMDSVGWALTSTGGDKLREQVQHHVRGRSAINMAIEDPERELYIISTTNPGHAIHITDQDFQLYKNGEVVSTYSRSKPDFYSRCMAACLAIPSAIVLTKEEFESPSVTPQAIRELPTIDLFPADTIEVTDDGYVNNHHDGYDTVQEQIRLNEIAHLVSQKMSLDDESNASWGTFDTSVSFSEFAGYETYRDMDEMKGREAEFEHFKRTVEHNRSHFTEEEVDMTDRSLDYIVSRAYVRSGTRPERETDSRTPDHGTPPR